MSTLSVILLTNSKCHEQIIKRKWKIYSNLWSPFNSTNDRYISQTSLACYRECYRKRYGPGPRVKGEAQKWTTIAMTRWKRAARTAYLTNNVVHSPRESFDNRRAARYITGAIIIICKPPPRASFSYLSRRPSHPVVLLDVSKWVSCLSRREWPRFRRDIRN